MRPAAPFDPDHQVVCPVPERDRGYRTQEIELETLDRPDEAAWQVMSRGQTTRREATKSPPSEDPRHK